MIRMCHVDDRIERSTSVRGCLYILDQKTTLVHIVVESQFKMKRATHFVSPSPGTGNTVLESPPYGINILHLPKRGTCQYWFKGAQRARQERGKRQRKVAPFYRMEWCYPK